MAHGHMNESPLYICTKGGKYIVRKEDGCLGEHYFSENDVVGYVKTNEDYVSKVKEGSKLCHLNHPEYEKLYHFTTDIEYYQTEEGRRYCINRGFIPLGIKYKRAKKTKAIEIKNKVNGEVVATYDLDTYESSVVSVLKE